MIEINPIRFEKHHFKQFMEFAFQSYSANDPFYLKNSDQREFFYSLSQKLIFNAIQAAQFINKRDGTEIIFNNCIIKDGKMVSALFNCDIDYYIKHFPKQISEQIWVKTVVPGTKGMVGIRHCVRKEYQNTNIYNRHFMYNMRYFVSKGYEYAYAMVYNPYSLSVPKKLGANILSDSKMIKGEIYQRFIVVMNAKQALHSLGKSSPSL